MSNIKSNPFVHFLTLLIYILIKMGLSQFMRSVCLLLLCCAMLITIAHHYHHHHSCHHDHHDHRRAKNKVLYVPAQN